VDDPERLAEYERLQKKVDEAEQRLPSSDKDLQRRFTDAKAQANKWPRRPQESYDVQFAGSRITAGSLPTSKRKMRRQSPSRLRCPIRSGASPASESELLLRPPAHSVRLRLGIREATLQILVARRQPLFGLIDLLLQALVFREAFGIVHSAKSGGG